MSKFNSFQQHSFDAKSEGKAFQNPMHLPMHQLNSEHPDHDSKKDRKSAVQKHHVQGLYDPNVIPCDWKIAANHALSRRVARELTDEECENPTYCVCCGYQVERVDLPYDCDPLDLKFLGSGFPLFYMFTKYCIFILVEFWLLKGMFSLATDLMGDYCFKTAIHSKKDAILKCGGSLWHFVSLANVYDRPDIRRLQTNLSLIVVIANMITFLFFRRAQTKIDIEVDESQVTPSDYTILVKNIPQTDKDLKEVLRNMFENAADGRELQVTDIVLVYDIDEVIELEEQMQDLVKEKQEYLEANNLNFNDFKVKQIDEKLESLEHKIHETEKELFHSKDKFAGVAFISFMTEQMKKVVLQHNRHTFLERIKAFFNNGKTNPEEDSNDLILEERKLYCEEAPEPNEVDWEFIHIPTGTKIKARIIAWGISVFFLIGCFFLIWFLSELAEKMNEEVEEQELKGIKNSTTQTIAFLTSQSISWTIIFFNKFVIGKVYHLIVDLEKISTKTKFNISFAIRQSAALFTNTALISLVIDFFITKNVIGKGGFIYNESNVFLLNAFIPPIVWFIDPWSIQKDYQRQKAMNNQKSCVLTQKEANELMEMPDYSQAKRYGDIMKTMWFTFFYGDIIPIGIIFSIMGLSLYYFIDKYNVLRRRTIKESLSKHLSLTMIQMLELIILFSGIGNLIVSIVLFGEINWQDITIIIISIIYIFFLPMEQISEILFPLGSEDETIDYKTAKENFVTSYEKENPVTRKEALKKEMLNYH